MNADTLSFFRRHWPLLLALLVGLVWRVWLWDRLPRNGLIGDEAEYLAAADWLALGRGFSWHLGWLWTRAPLYPLFLAAHFALFGSSLTPIFMSQIALSLLNVALVYGLALLLEHRTENTERSDRRVGGVAALLMALYLPFASYTQLVLSETLFLSLLLAGFVALARWEERRVQNPEPRTQNPEPRTQNPELRTQNPEPRTQNPEPRTQNPEPRTQNPEPRTQNPERGALQSAIRLLALAAICFGLATLTRGLTLAFLPLVVLWVVWIEFRIQDSRFRKTKTAESYHRNWFSVLSSEFSVLSSRFSAALFLVLCALTIAPWSWYASRAYGGAVIVDTTGAFNLLLGARTAYDGGRDDAASRAFVLALLDAQLSDEARLAVMRGTSTLDGLEQNTSCLYRAGDEQLLAALLRPVSAITQVERQQLMSAEALCLLRAKPLDFVEKSLVELVDFFKINYSGAERLTDGFALGWMPRWYTGALFLLDDTIYVLCLPLAVLGWALLRHRGAAAITTLIGLWLLYNLATAPLLFAINRFRLPLLPFCFILAAYALVQLPQGWRSLRSRYGVACLTLAALLALIAWAPHSYLDLRAPGGESQLASYLGPYPSSLNASGIAWARRPNFEREQELQSALQLRDGERAAAILADDLPLYTRAVGEALLLAQRGASTEALARIDTAPFLDDWQREVVRGELLRQSGDWEAARRALNPTLIDDQNPVEWAWRWLTPPPLPDNRIALADDNDLGYIRGFYLGEFDTTLSATVRWAGPRTQLRFPQAAIAAPQQLCLNLAGSGWPVDLQLPILMLFIGEEAIGEIQLSRELREQCLDLPSASAGEDIVISITSASFVPAAADLLGQQGPQVGQLRRLAYQLDWAEVREQNKGTKELGN